MKKLILLILLSACTTDKADFLDGKHLCLEDGNIYKLSSHVGDAMFIRKVDYLKCSFKKELK